MTTVKISDYKMLTIDEFVNDILIEFYLRQVDALLKLKFELSIRVITNIICIIVIG